VDQNTGSGCDYRGVDRGDKVGVRQESFVFARAEGTIAEVNGLLNASVGAKDGSEPGTVGEMVRGMRAAGRKG